MLFLSYDDYKTGKINIFIIFKNQKRITIVQDV